MVYGLPVLYAWIPTSCQPSSSSRAAPCRSEEHTSELQSHLNLVCRLLLEKKKNNYTKHTTYNLGLHRIHVNQNSRRWRAGFGAGQVSRSAKQLRQAHPPERAMCLSDIV